MIIQSAAGKERTGDAKSGPDKAFFGKRFGLKEGLLAAALFASGCAHLREDAPGALPRGPVQAYPVDSETQAVRIAVGDETDVLFRATVFIDDGKRQSHIVDFETAHGPQEITYCWFVFQDIGVADGNGPVYFLLNPRYKDPGQQRYIGALRSYPIVTEVPSPPLEAVVPVEKEEVMTYNDLWKIAPFPSSRENALFFIVPGTFMPVLDRDLLPHLGGYCKETVSPQIAVAEYGPTYASLVVYPGGR